MSSPYGQSFAAKLLAEGRLDAAVAAATSAIAADGSDPEPLFQRAQALVLLGRHDEALADLDDARTLDGDAGVLDDDGLDDETWSAVIGAARAAADADPAEGERVLARYSQRYPRGRHAKDASAWAQRFRGEWRTAFVKRRVDDPDVA